MQVWLPLAGEGGTGGWNGRFVGVGGGGYSAGQFGSEAFGARVAQGYAGESPFLIWVFAFRSYEFGSVSAVCTWVGLQRMLRADWNA